MSTTPETVLVTGAAGFVGSRVVELLASTTDYRILATDVVANSRAEELSRMKPVKFQRLDLRDLAGLNALVAASDAIVHLAAVRTQDSRAQPRIAHDVNVGTTYDLLSLATEHQVPRFVFGSTNTLYGPYTDASAGPVDEDQPWVCRGINMYAATKLASEAYLEAFAGSGGPAYLALRIGPIYGPRMSSGSNGAMLLDILHALDAGHAPSVAWTSDSIHSFVHVDDVAKAVVASLTATAMGSAVNVAGSPVSTQEFCGRLVELYGHDPSSIEWRGDRVRYQRVSQERMKQVLGFAPATTLDEGLRTVIDWHRTRP